MVRWLISQRQAARGQLQDSDASVVRPLCGSDTPTTVTPQSRPLTLQPAVGRHHGQALVRGLSFRKFRDPGYLHTPWSASWGLVSVVEAMVPPFRPNHRFARTSPRLFRLRVSSNAI